MQCFWAPKFKAVLIRSTLDFWQISRYVNIAETFLKGQNFGKCEMQGCAECLFVFCPDIPYKDYNAHSWWIDLGSVETDSPPPGSFREIFMYKKKRLILGCVTLKLKFELI